MAALGLPSPASLRSALAGATAGESVIRRLARSSMQALPIYVIGVGTSYVAQLVLARVLGPQEFGVYAYVMAVVTVLAYCSALGLDSALMRFVPSYSRTESWGFVAGVIRYAERMAILAGLLLAACGVLILFTTNSRYGTALRVPLMLGFALAPVLALVLIRSAVARSFGEVVSAVAADRFVREGGLLILIVLSVLVFGSSLSASAAMAGTLLSSLAALLLVSRAVRRRRPSSLAAQDPMFDRTAWRRASFPFLIIVAAEALMNRSGSLVFGSVGQATDAGVFALCWNLAMLVTLPKSAVNTLFIPTIAELYAGREFDKLRRVVSVSALWMLLGAGALGLLVWAASDVLLALYGPAFAKAGSCVTIMILGNVVVAGMGSQVYIMTMTGREGQAALLAGLGTLVSLGASIALIPRFGLIGSAWASAGSLLLWNLAMSVAIWRHLGQLPGVLASLSAPGTAPAGELDRGDGNSTAMGMVP